MEEVFPILGGIVLGLYFSQRTVKAAGGGLLALLAVLIAITASYISGELKQSWLFVLQDLAEVAVAAIGAGLLGRLLLGQRSHRRR